MVTLQGNLIEDIRYYKVIMSELKKLGEQIDENARELLKELQRVDGWECMFEECREHYESYKKGFFNSCAVTHSDKAVQFVKGYSDGSEYEVLEIGLYESLSAQVRNRLVELRDKEEKEAEEEEKKELAELRRLKEKYEK